MVEPPGTAPGSDPLITCAFMSIVRVAPNEDQDRRQQGAVQGPRQGAFAGLTRGEARRDGTFAPG